MVETDSTEAVVVERAFLPHGADGTVREAVVPRHAHNRANLRILPKNLRTDCDCVVKGTREGGSKKARMKRDQERDDFSWSESWCGWDRKWFAPRPARPPARCVQREDFSASSLHRDLPCGAAH